MHPKAICAPSLIIFWVCSILSAQPDKALQPGTALPDFELRDQSGQNRTFSDLRGPKGAMVVFYRSADW